MSLLDRLIAAVSPEAALRRQRARLQLAHVRAYEGASRNDGWRVRRAGASGRTDAAVDGRELRHRARALEQNVPYVQRALDARVSAAIGAGIDPKSTARQGEKIDALWRAWSAVADADGVFNIAGLQALAYRAMLRDGEVLIRRRMRRSSDGLPVPVQVQVLEIDWLDESKTGPGDGGGRIIGGIEYDGIGRVAAYWLHPEHPGDRLGHGSRRASQRVPAAHIIHLYKPQRPGQGRGISALASIIARTRDLMLYEDAELARKNLESRLGVIVSGDPELLSNAVDPATGDPAALTTGHLGDLPSGGITSIPAGLSPTLIQPHAVGGHVEYCKHALHLIAAGLGVPYESMTGDMREVNYSSARIRQIEFRRDIEQEQWLTLVPVLCERLWQWFIDAAVLSGQLPRPEYGVDWATPRWDYVNPKQDIDSECQAIAFGLMSPSESLRRRGYDPAHVFAEIGADFNTLREAGALDLMEFLRRTRRGEAAAPQEDE